MGGGDLNLKKSWHPSTMRNMEKVWKAEQKHDQEKKRIAELQREIQEEKAREDIKKYAEDQGVIEKKSDVKLDWMYKGPGSGVDREEYLLGKAIDKNFEQLQRTEQSNTSVCVPGRTDSCLPGSIFAGSGEQVDIARKLQEDPLLVIRKKEIESRSQILKNPVKLKQLRSLIKEQKSKKSKKQKKEKKKKKKSKKRKKHSSSSEDSDSDSDLDAKLLAKYQKLKEKLGESGLAALHSSSQKKKKEKSSHRKRTRSSSSSSSSEEEQQPKRDKKAYGLQLHPNAKHKDKSIKASVKEVSLKQPEPQKEIQHTVERKKLTDEEKERRRQEMLDNARWREREREHNVARYREADRRDQSQSQKEFDDNFMRKQLSKAAAQSSVASRIKSNINNIQRTGGSMDKNFARR